MTVGDDTDLCESSSEIVSVACELIDAAFAFVRAIESHDDFHRRQNLLCDWR